MDITSTIHTIAQGHSVKEAVVTFFIQAPIRFPDSYRTLLEVGLNGYYAQFEPVKQVTVGFDMKLSSNFVKRLEDSGFKLIGFDKGMVSNVIQGLNQPGRSIFTFNNLVYKDWNSFLVMLYKSANAIADFTPKEMADRPVYPISAFSLLYIDEFYFDHASDYYPSDLFRKESDYLPKGFFDSSLADYNLNLNRNDGYPVQENLTVNVFNENGRKTIRITHNNTVIIEMSPCPFKALLEGNFLKERLEKAHDLNKAMLKDILNNKIVESIKL